MIAGSNDSEIRLRHQSFLNIAKVVQDMTLLDNDAIAESCILEIRSEKRGLKKSWRIEACRLSPQGSLAKKSTELVQRFH